MPALIGATIVVIASSAGVHGPVWPVLGAATCFVIRLAGIRFDLNVPRPPATSAADGTGGGP